MAHPKSQHEALLRGKRHYWTGKACKHGHVAFRFATNGACMECRRIDQSARYMRKKNGETKENRRRKRCVG